MSKTLAQIVCQLLIDLDLGVDPEDEDNAGLDWHVFYGVVPEDPDNIITVTDTAGLYQGRSQRGQSFEIPAFQIRVRGIDYDTGSQRMELIKEAMDGVIRQLVVLQAGVEEYIVNGLHRQGGLGVLGPEETNRRERFTRNFTGSFSSNI